MRAVLPALVVIAIGAAETDQAARATDLAPPPVRVAAPVAPPPPAPVAYDIPSAGVIDPGDRWDIRGGLFAHGFGGAEREVHTVDVNLELVSPRLFSAPGVWHYFVPRWAAGGSLNTAGRTSFAYTGPVWTFPIYGNFFGEIATGVSVHNGLIAGDATHAVLGCRMLFHHDFSLGYRFNENWSAIASFEHLSNGKQLIGWNCGTNQNLPGSGNQGLNNFGIRVGYTF